MNNIQYILLLIIFVCSGVYPICIMSKKFYLAGNRIDKVKYLYGIT